MAKAHCNILLFNKKLQYVFILEHIDREPLHFYKFVCAEDLQTHEEYVTIPYRYLMYDLDGGLNDEISQTYFEHIKQLNTEVESNEKE